MGTRRSRHNKGRKPLYKEHRQHLVLEPAEAILSRRPRYGGLWMDQGRQWPAEDHAALFSLCGASADIEASADILGRTPKTLAHRALDIGIRIPKPWWEFALSPRRWQEHLDAVARRDERRARKAAEIAAEREARKRPLMQYPFVSEPADDRLDLLAVNALVPKGLAEWIRADICQNIMLALLEGETTIADLKANRASTGYFIRKFYRDEVDRNLVSFDHRDDERAYDEIAGAMAREDWNWREVNDRRRAYSTLATFTHPEQIGAVYEAEIRRAQQKAHDSGRYLSFNETEREVA